MTAPRFGPIGLGNITPPPWDRGAATQGRNLIYGIDPADGSPQLVAEVFGYTQEEVDANIRFILNASRDKFWGMTP